MENKLLNKFKGAMLFSATGDALGWPLEFSKKPPEEEVKEFLNWKKKVGGKWFGYEDEILPGEYSDDTQLLLSVARSIDDNGNFEPTYFAYLEFPLWLDYGRGGGRIVKLAAKNLHKKSVYWYSNFYSRKEEKYIKAITNGSAMRNLPISLVNIDNEDRFIRDTLVNTIISHGHPKAIIGSLVIGSAQIYLLKDNKPSEKMLDYIKYILNKTFNFLEENKIKELDKWLFYIKKEFNVDYASFYKKNLKEVEIFINNIPKYLTKDDKDYYGFVGAISTEYKQRGSGASSTCAGVYMFLKYLDNPEDAIIKSANMVGSDTDTIANFVGSLVGSYFGMNVNFHLLELSKQLQDSDYITKLAENLWSIYKGNLDKKTTKKISREDGYLKLQIWKEDLEYFMKRENNEGKIIIHPTLGKGIIEKEMKKIIPMKKEYTAKILKVKFDCGQSVYFHMRKKI